MQSMRWFCLLLVIAVPLGAQSEDQIDRWADRAERAVDRGQWRRARNFLEKYLAAEDDDLEAQAKLLLAYEATGKVDQRDALTQSRLGAQPELETRWIDRINFLRHVGRDDDALDLIAKAPPAIQGSWSLQALKGRIMVDRGRDEAAEKIFEALVDRAKEVVVREPQDLWGLAQAYLFYPHGGDSAEESLFVAQKKDPKFLPAYSLMAKVYTDPKERPGDVMREFKDALALRPNWPEFLMGQARATELWLGIKEGQKKTLVDRVLRIDQGHPDALFMRGESQLGGGAWDEAQSTFEKALERNPHHRKALSGLAARAWLAGDQVAYERALKKVFDRDPTYGRVHRIIASALNQRRRWPESLEQMKLAVKVDPKDARLWDDLARYALYVGQEELGRDALEKANDLVTNGTVWRNNMAMVMGKLAKDYKTHKTDHYVLKFHKKDDGALRRFFPQFVEASWREFAERYSFEPQAPVIFEVFETSKDFSVRTMGTRGLPALGVCFGTTVAMDSPRARRRGTYNWAATAHHEIAHIFTLQLSQGRVPRWLTEGISSWEERRRSESWGRDMEFMLHDARANQEIFPVLQFDAAFSTSRIGFAYFQGGLVAEWIEKKWGVDKVVAMLRAYGKDLGTDAILRKVLGTTPKAFDAGFLKFVDEKLAPMKRIPTWSDASMERFQAAVDDKKDVDEHRIRLAWGHFRRGRFIDADAQLLALENAEVKDARIHFLRGLRALRGEVRELAERELKRASEMGLEDFELSYALGTMAQTDGRDEDARLHFESAARFYPWAADGRSAHLALAKMAKASGDLDSWAQWTEKFCRIVDTALPERKALLSYYHSQKNSKEMRRLHRELERLIPFDTKLRLRRGKWLQGMDETEAARLQFEIAVGLEADPKTEILLRLELSEMARTAGDDDDAAYHLERILELDPNHAEAAKKLKLIPGEEDDEK